MRPAATAAATLLAALLRAGAAAAQVPAEPAAIDARARSLFFEGVEALEHNELDRALAALRASFALRPRPIVVLNIAQALRAARRTVEAIAAFEEYLALGAGEVPPDRAASVRDTITFLRRSLARLVVQSEPPGAVVRIDARLAGTTPLADALTVGAGPHTIELARDGFVLVRERVTVLPGERRALRFVLPSVATASTLRVSVAGAPAGARVAIDGMSVGPPPVMRRLEPGGHQVEVRAPGHEPWRAEVVLGALQQRALGVRLEPTRSVLARPWFWGTAGAIVVGAVAAGVAIALTRPEASREPYIDVPPVPAGP